ncbi:hypothetical protein A7E59_00260 [Staphylococcus carnosus]|uniref:NAD-dependent deacetylase n=1 Tax=Staphylococcus carnosus TaxID=1281 RepID=A0AAJ0JPE4_STACA|nr:hypothetical protein VV61_05370 [Staphylococcus carnosus]UTB83996.1 hypothetical protein A2I67_12410 [Staphylococcus carnosus]UTB99337.1 hypothetical protein A7E59_00260 [Staphylococcus carnosus]UTC03869.1 hypothetical protein A2I68_12525 [Staphylococcus carnosus]
MTFDWDIFYISVGFLGETNGISNFTGQNLIIINRDPTPFDRDAQLVIHDDMVSVVEQLQNND